MRPESPPMRLWKPSRSTRIEVPGFCIMHGGPVGMYIPEHEHPEVQLVASFLPARKDSGAPREDIPRSFRIIPSGQPHVGHWPDGNEVIVVLISQSLIELGAS